MMIITVLTNASGFPATYFSWKISSTFQAIVGFFTVIYSTVYHLADTIDGTVANMTEGNWHRLDNIFAILSFANLFLYLSECTEPEHIFQSIRSGIIIFTITCQEIGPWQLEFTLLPIFIAFAFCIFHLIRNHRVRESLSKGGNGNFTTAFFLAFGGILGFIKGLEQDHDYLRIAHGCWHLLTGFSLYFFAKGLDYVVKRSQEGGKRDV